MELGTILFALRMVFDSVPTNVLKGAACETLVMIPVCQHHIVVFQVFGTFLLPS